MIESTRLTHGRRKLSDAALDGLFGGLAAGAAMGVYVIAWGLASGRGPGAVLGMFDPAMRANPLSGALTHLAVASVYGILFGLIWWVTRRVALTPRPPLPLRQERGPGGEVITWGRLRLPGWLFGAAYGLALLLAAAAVVLPAAGSPLAEIPTLHFAIAHVVYGVVLGHLTEQIGERHV